MVTTTRLPNLKGTQWENKTEEEIFVEFQHLVHATINKQFPNKRRFLSAHMLDEDDIVQLGNIGLWEAIKTYDPNNDTNTQLKSYIISNISWKIKRFVREYSLRNKKNSLELADVVSTQDKISSSSEDESMTIETSLIDSDINVEDETEDTVLINKIKEVLKQEDDRQYAKKMEHIIFARIKGKTEEEIGNELGITKSAVNMFMNTKKAKKLKEKLRKCF